jgi:uncharacterized protein
MDGAAEAPPFDYPALMRGALVGVVRTVLARAAEEGLPGEHHFYLTFGTGDAGVEVPAPLRKRFPDEMTIVLQHQFWNLAVDDAGFSVTLRFSGRPERLVVPWPALRAFVDPSVEFGFRLQPAIDETPAGTDAPAPRADAPPAKAGGGGRAAWGGRPPRPPRPAPEAARPATEVHDDPPGATPAPRKVVDIGPFRRGPGTGRRR